MPSAGGSAPAAAARATSKMADRAVGADDAERALAILDVGGGRLEQMRRHRRAGRDHRVRGFDRRAARPHHRARGERAHALRHPVGVAHDDAHRLERHAEPLGDHLGEDGLVALALRVGCPAAPRRLPSAARAPPRTPAARRRCPRCTARGRCRAAGRGAPPRRGAPGIPRRRGALDRLVEPGDVVARVVERARRRSIRKRPHHVGAPERGRVAAGLARGALDQPLHGVDALQAADAAIDVDGHGVGEHALDPQMDRGDGVEPGDHPLHVGQGRDRDARRDVGAEVRPRAHAERDDPARRVERELARQHVVARLHVADEPLGPARDPLHRAAQVARRPRERHVLGIHLDLGAESASDVAGDAPNAFGRHAEDAREIGGELMHALEPGVERVAPGGGVPLGQRGARLQKAGDEPIVDERQPRDVGGGGDGARGGFGVAALPVVRRGCRGRRRAPRARPRRGPSIASTTARRAAYRTATASAPSRAAAAVVGDDDRDGLADVTHAVDRQRIATAAPRRATRRGYGCRRRAPRSASGSRRRRRRRDRAR